MSNKQMSEEFCVVSRKKWLARKNMQRPRPRLISSEKYDDCPPVDVDKFLKRLEHLCEQMTASDYFTQSTATLTSALAKLKQSPPGGGEQTADGPPPQMQRLVCFGIGPFTRNYHALHQLAFIVNARRHYDIPEAVYFDPVFDETEKEVLKRLQCSLMPGNCEAKYEADVLTLFYMPHCPNALTNNLLWRNWRPQQLHNTVLINNSFDSLTTNKPERLLRLDSQFILDVLPHTTELPLEDEYETRNVFNDLSVHVFPLAALPPAEAEYWRETAAPTYKDLESLEMVSAEDFAKLALT